MTNVQQMSDEDIKRFWSKVDRDGPHYANLGPCWLWRGGTHEGYGKFHVQRVPQMAHRVAFALIRGSMPPKPLVLDHLCRVRNCVNPTHLDPVTDAVNLSRSNTASTLNAKKTHCPRGHEYLQSSTYVDRKGTRHCRICKNDRRREIYKPTYESYRRCVVCNAAGARTVTASGFVHRRCQ